ncbi:MAG: hypothetical protein ACRDOB_02855 [Streptosporangiaceae bacterium]
MQEMNAAVRGPRSMPTWLTGTAGLLVLVLALVMMVLAAPTGASPAGHAAQQDPAQQPALSPAATLSVTARHVPGPPLTRHDRIVRDLGLQ